MGLPQSIAAPTWEPVDEAFFLAVDEVIFLCVPKSGQNMRNLNTQNRLEMYDIDLKPTFTIKNKPTCR